MAETAAAQAAAAPVANRAGWRWRGAYSVAVVVAVTGLLTGLGSATLSTTGTGTGSASTGTVTLSVNASATKTCGYNALLPGDLTGSATCAFSVGYTGTLPAYVSLTVEIQSKAGPGGQRLYDGSGSSGLTLSISDGQNGYKVPTGTGVSDGSCPSGFTCWTAANDLAAWYSGTTPSLTFVAGKSVTFTITPQFPKTVGNGYQGGTAIVTLTAQAVQVIANPLPASCTIATIGQPCPAAGTFTWS
jgi:hypothetical protein